MNTKTGIRFLVTTRCKEIREFDVTLPVAPAGIVGSGCMGDYVIGNTGPVGPAGTIDIGKVTAGDTDCDAEVRNVGSDSHAVLDFVIPRGKTGPKGSKGDTGETPIIEAGKTVTLCADEQARVSTSKTDDTTTFEFAIPKGHRGDKGEKGCKGDIGLTPLIEAGVTQTLAPSELAKVDANTCGITTTFDFSIPQGKKGDQGIAGLDGTQIIVNSVDPVVADARDNIVWLNSVTGELFETIQSNDGSYRWSRLGNLKGNPGNRIYSGHVDPSVESFHKTGDLYFNTTNNNLYSFSDTQWIKLSTLKGDQGTRGSIWFKGTTSPVSGPDTQSGDYYLNTDTSEISFYNGSNWQSIGSFKGDIGKSGTITIRNVTESDKVSVTNVGSAEDAVLDFTIPRGNKGDQGDKGTRGSLWLRGEGKPALSKELQFSDFYLDTTTSDIYWYTDSEWKKIGSIKGDEGIPGPEGIQGPQGAQGDKGTRGSLWLRGEGKPALSKELQFGDFYLDTTTSDIYWYTDSEWKNTGSFKGENGKSATITIRDVIEGDTVSVTNVGTAEDAILDFTIPKGENAPTITSISASLSGFIFQMSDGSSWDVVPEGIYIENGNMVVPETIGELPDDFVLNGNIYTAPDAYLNGTKQIPDGLSLNSNIVMTDGSVFFPKTINNSGVLCAA